MIEHLYKRGDRRQESLKNKILLRLDWIEFEMFNEFEMPRIRLKTFLRIVLITCKTIPVKQCTNREDNTKISKFSSTIVVVARTMKVLAVVTPPYIYQNINKYKEHLIMDNVMVVLYL